MKTREVEGEGEGKTEVGRWEPGGQTRGDEGGRRERERVGDALEKFSRERDNHWKVKFEERGW